MDQRHALDNNLALYEAVLAAHGVTGALTDAYWSTSDPLPPYWSNLLTRTGSPGADAQLARLRELGRTPPMDVWGLKDGFATLDERALNREGLHWLFDARWYGFEAGRLDPEARETNEEFHEVDDPDDLLLWDVAWEPRVIAEKGRQFPDAVLDRDDLVFLRSCPRDRLAARRVQGLSGGVLANLSREAVGLSNLFWSRGDMPVAFLRDAVRELAARFPDRHVVGYEQADVLARLATLAPADLGPLRVYVTDPGGGLARRNAALREQGLR